MQFDINITSSSPSGRCPEQPHGQLPAREAEMRHPKTLIELMQLYPTEDECRQAIFEQRWPHGFRCRRCGHECAWYLPGRGLLECASRHHQGSLTAGAILY